MDSPSRFAFVELLRDFYRGNDTELPFFASDPNQALAFDVLVDDVAFTVSHDPGHSIDEFFVQCRFGAIPTHADTAAILRQLLCMNLSLAWNVPATLGIDAESNEVLCMFSASTEAVDARALRETMLAMAAQARRWQQTYFLDAPSGVPIGTGCATPLWADGLLA